MKKLATVPMVAALALVGCGQDDMEMLIDDATASAALSQGEGESLDGVPSGDLDGGAQEDADESLADDGLLAADCSFAAMRRNVIDTYDDNGNGEIDGDEGDELRGDFGDQPLRRRVRWARHHRLQRLHWVYDTDGSGDLDEAERAEVRADVEARCEARMAYLLEHFDADSDGALSDDEWTAVREELTARIRARRQAVLAEFDTNGNGMLDQTEIQALREHMRSRIQARRDEVRAQFDADSNGELDADEREALREYLRARVRGEYFGSEDRF